MLITFGSHLIFIKDARVYMISLVLADLFSKTVSYYDIVNINTDQRTVAQGSRQFCWLAFIVSILLYGQNILRGIFFEVLTYEGWLQGVC